MFCAELYLTRAAHHSGEAPAPEGVITGSGRGVAAPTGVARHAGAVSGRPGEDARAMPAVALMNDDGY